MTIPVDDATANDVRCPSCNGLIAIRPVVIAGEEATRWTGGIEVKHAAPPCEWSKVPANVNAWLHVTLSTALLRGGDGEQS